MQPNRLSIILQKAFSFLYYGQFVLYLLLLPVFWLVFGWLLPAWQIRAYDFPEEGPRVVYDTLTNGQSREVTVTKALEDTLMNYDKLTERDTIYTSGPDGKITRKRVKDPKDSWRLHHDMVRERDSAQRVITQMNQKRYKRAVDSIIKNHPEQYLVVKKDGYKALNNDFRFTINWVLRGNVMPAPGYSPHAWYSDRQDLMKNWNYALTKRPDVDISNQTISGKMFNVSFMFSSWREVKNVPWYVILVWFLNFCIDLLFLPITYQFMKLFEAVNTRQVFTAIQIRRLSWIGALLCSYAFCNFIMSEVRVYAATAYLRTQGLEFMHQRRVEHLFSDNLVWLITGLSILTLAQVFRYGFQLKQESELTI